jgi:hypothetical protein
MKTILITYDETQETESGEPLDLFCWLENELNACGIEATIDEANSAGILEAQSQT